MAVVKTAKVVRKDHPSGYVVINECDMTDKDELYIEPAPKSVDEKVEEAIQEEEKPGKSGKK